MSKHLPITSLLLACGLLLGSFGAHAEPLLNGLAPHMELGKEKFIAGLYVDSLSNDAGEILQSTENKRMELHITAKRLSNRSLKRMWIEGMAINTPSGQLSKYANDTVSFASLFKKKLVAGDVIRIDRTVSDGTIVSVNGVELGSLYTEGFFEVLLRTWIGSVPLSSDFRNQLLQSGDVNAEMLARYELVTPSPERIAAIEAWIAPPEPVRSEATEQLAAAPAIAAPTVQTPAVTAPKLDTDATSSPAVSAESPADINGTETQVAVAEQQQEPATEPAPAPVEAETVAAVPAERTEEPEDLDDEEEGDDIELTAESLIARQMYNSSLLRWAYKAMTYPNRAVQRNQEGSVRISVTIDREGKILEQQTIEESRYGLLNRAAQTAVKRSEPFPAMPDAIAGDSFVFTLPIVFRLPK